VRRPGVFQRILLALDHTPQARRALEHAVALAEAFSGRLTIVTVVGRPSTLVAIAGVHPETLLHDEQDRARDLQREVLAELPSSVLVTTVVRTGDAGAQIAAVAKDGSHDLIVIGSRGRSRFAETAFGSVAASVHFHTSAALLIVHPERDR
jgi:nucleotide-binding universal stress UspA family protein